MGYIFELALSFLLPLFSFRYTHYSSISFADISCGVFFIFIFLLLRKCLLPLESCLCFCIYFTPFSIWLALFSKFTSLFFIPFIEFLNSKMSVWVFYNFNLFGEVFLPWFYFWIHWLVYLSFHVSCWGCFFFFLELPSWIFCHSNHSLWFFRFMFWIFKIFFLPWLVKLSGLSTGCEPKGHLLHSQSGHMSGLWARSPVGATWEATTYWCFSPSLSPFLPPLWT